MAAEPQVKTNQVLVTVVLDRSGSMSSNRGGTISGYNEYIQGLRLDGDSDYFVTLIQFDAPMANPELTVNYQDCALADVPELTPQHYVPRGNTPLYDAIGECIRRTDPKGRAAIVLVITDGEENASSEFTRESVKTLLKEKESEGWTFAFLGADIDSYAVGGSVGVSPSNTANYVKGNEKALFSNLAKSTIQRAAGARSVGPNTAADTDFIDVPSGRRWWKTGGGQEVGGRLRRPCYGAPGQQRDIHSPATGQSKTREYPLGSNSFAIRLERVWRRCRRPGGNRRDATGTRLTLWLDRPRKRTPRNTS